MLVQALAEYADRRLADQLRDPAFEEKPVPFFLEISKDGSFRTVVEHTRPVQRGKKTVDVPAALLVPKSPVNRTTGLHPLLACDDLKYVLGVGEWTAKKQEANHKERHEAFIALLRRAAAEVSDDGLHACVSFYDRPAEVERARQELGQREAKSGMVALSLPATGPVVRRPGVREWWKRHFEQAFATRTEKGGEGMCLVSGRLGPVAPTHEKVKGLANVGGQAAGVSLMSFDKQAFRSYGWDQNANSPVSPDRATAYVLALNDLLRPGRRSRVDHGGVAFLFWTKTPVEWSPLDILEQADPEQVRNLLTLQDEGADIEPNEFYTLGVSGNGARLLVRYWIHESLSKVKRNVAAWFRGLRIASPFTGAIAEPPKIWQILRAIAREEPPPDRAVQCYRRAIHGQPLGRNILAAALTRVRLSQGANKLDTARAGLIRLCTNDLMKGGNMGEQLDPSLEHPAYLCGRLLAIYDGLQYATQGEVNASVSDRYYTLASSQPQLAFPKLADLALKHLRKLRRDNRPAAVSIERQIQEVHERIARQGARYPSPLSLEDQGRFAIGFHHQRAEAMKQAMARKAEKTAKGAKQ